MADGKKSFIVYTSWKLWLDALSDSQKGQWLEWMFNYCNDLNPSYPEDKAVEIACRMAQDTLKRDLKKYEARVERIQRINIEKKQNEIDTKSTRNRNDIECVNVNDNVNVNVNDINNTINNNIVSKDTCGEVSQEKPTPLIILPCTKGYNHPIYEEDIEHYKELYPAVDILQELKKMLGWLESNPSNKKTENGIKAFITRWLGKCQDKAPKVETQNKTGFGEYDVVDGFGGGFQKLGETDEEYEKRTGIKRYKPNKRNFDDPDGFGGNTL